MCTPATAWKRIRFSKFSRKQLAQSKAGGGKTPPVFASELENFKRAWNANPQAGIAAVTEGLDRRLLADVQVRVVGEAGERYLVVAGYVETKPPEAEVPAR